MLPDQIATQSPSSACTPQSVPRSFLVREGLQPSNGQALERSARVRELFLRNAVLRAFWDGTYVRALNSVGTSRTGQIRRWARAWVCWRGTGCLVPIRPLCSRGPAAVHLPGADAFLDLPIARLHTCSEALALDGHRRRAQGAGCERCCASDVLTNVLIAHLLAGATLASEGLMLQ